MAHLDVRKFLGTDWIRTEELIRSQLASDIDLLNRTNDDLLSNSGKQIRPALSLLVARACADGPIGELSWRYAAAAELLHNATLLHDDVADASDERRGRPTVNALMGPRVSVLVGDYWLVRAVGCILDAEGCHMEVIRLFAGTLRNLAEGEMFQLQKAQTVDTGIDDYLRIIYCKTATLFETTARSAAISAGADAGLVEKMGEYARCIGMAFQVRDDIFDYTPGIDVGKPVGADLLEKKITLPLLGAFSNAGAGEEARIRALLRRVGVEPDVCGEIYDFVIENGGVAWAQERLQEYVNEALSLLAVLRHSPERDCLEELTRYVGNRNI